LSQAQLRRNRDVPSGSDHVGNAAQQLTCRRWGVWDRYAIALRNPLRAAGNVDYRDQAMGAQLAFPSEQNDLSDVELILGDALDQERVTGPNSRQHAPTGRGKTKAAERA
jgi:hypothetical protein